MKKFVCFIGLIAVCSLFIQCSKESKENEGGTHDKLKLSPSAWLLGNWYCYGDIYDGDYDYEAIFKDTTKTEQQIIDELNAYFESQGSDFRFSSKQEIINFKNPTINIASNIIFNDKIYNINRDIVSSFQTTEGVIEVVEPVKTDNQYHILITEIKYNGDAVSRIFTFAKIADGKVNITSKKQTTSRTDTISWFWDGKYKKY